jgi:serine kinase of HPr protein (carbohydrate metabolism regulator)
MNQVSTVHASAVLVGEAGVLIRGASGSGKSSLALSLIDAASPTAWLVADDRVALAVHHGRLVAAAPPAIAGKIEIRGIGIVEVAHVSPVVVRLLVDLLPPANCPRLPEPDQLRGSIEGVVLPRLSLPSHAADGAARVHAALRPGGIGAA